MGKEDLIQAGIGLSFISTQLKDMLKPCAELLQIAIDNSHSSGREIDLSFVMENIFFISFIHQTINDKFSYFWIVAISNNWGQSFIFFII